MSSNLPPSEEAVVELDVSEVQSPAVAAAPTGTTTEAAIVVDRTPTKVQRTEINVDGVPENKVFIGCIPQTVSDERLKRELRGIGSSTEERSQPRKILGLCYVRDGQQSDRGVAFVTFSSKEEAEECVNEMNGKFVFKNANRPVHAKLTCEKLHENLSGTVFDRSPSIYGKKLPHTHWTEYTADDTGLVYYNNDTTGESVWEKPECLAEAEEDLPPEPSPTDTTPEDGGDEEIQCD
ncbi:hypothetical protein Pmar_PMAR006726 [Perkinsus marinus ATCC 50983]|uniref:Uncharacterized protein n=1 Tax=Perkinsus marinus (strain ATCC 50983 / TXsc) TaxID=423536 RepID=C5K6B4_PERM5|nr:hypothetical protein Pmar_PMAR006726 [Perkinsus marinus ATCC 50983]EER19834.1 hypothetical protein Pmar_PMAR006726 [Perkinsus marinus ATCC 50983]|eukprot:XP_002788038.1 hypothetical protein Pmar_PMAR006726 [Perkinsus marinus ATCC 50983]